MSKERYAYRVYIEAWASQFMFIIKQWRNRCSKRYDKKTSSAYTSAFAPARINPVHFLCSIFLSAWSSTHQLFTNALACILTSPDILKRILKFPVYRKILRKHPWRKWQWECLHFYAMGMWGGADVQPMETSKAMATLVAFPIGF